MKNILFFIALLFFFGCTNNVPSESEAATADSTIAMSLSSESLAAPGSTTKIIVQLLPNKDTNWIIITTDPGGCSIVTEELHPYKPVVQPPADNKPPSVKTGPDQTTSGTSVTLNGSGSTDPDGTIASYKWEQTKGNAATLTQVNAVCNVSGLFTGHYTFKLTVADNYGATASDTVHVTVTGSTPPPPGNQLPVVAVSGSQTITLPASSVTLTGSATDGDGTIVSYLWTKTSGTGGTINSPTVKNTVVSNLTQGSYVFSLKATDNAGGSASKTVSVVVNGSTTTPPPTAGYTLTFSTGYDTQADMLYGGNGQYGNGKISTTTYKTGPGSFYAIPANVSSGIRAEVQYTGAAQNPTEGAVEWDVYYEVVVGSNMCSIQWHPNTSGSSGAPFLQHVEGKFVWTNWKGGGNTNYPTGVTIPQGKWLHMRVEYKFGSSGYLRHWIDGVQVLNKSGIQLGDGSGQYIKVGTNGWMSTAAASRSYYDNLRIYKKN